MKLLLPIVAIVLISSGALIFIKDRQNQKLSYAQVIDAMPSAPYRSFMQSLNLLPSAPTYAPPVSSPSPSVIPYNSPSSALQNNASSQMGGLDVGSARYRAPACSSYGTSNSGTGAVCIGGTYDGATCDWAVDWGVSRNRCRAYGGRCGAQCEQHLHRCAYVAYDPSCAYIPPDSIKSRGVCEATPPGNGADEYGLRQCGLNRFNICKLVNGGCEATLFSDSNSDECQAEFESSGDCFIWKSCKVGGYPAHACKKKR